MVENGRVYPPIQCQYHWSASAPEVKSRTADPPLPKEQPDPATQPKQPHCSDAVPSSDVTLVGWVASSHK